MQEEFDLTHALELAAKDWLRDIQAAEAAEEAAPPRKARRKKPQPKPAKPQRARIDTGLKALRRGRKKRRAKKSAKKASGEAPLDERSAEADAPEAQRMDFEQVLCISPTACPPSLTFCRAAVVPSFDAPMRPPRCSSSNRSSS